MPRCSRGIWRMRALGGGEHPVEPPRQLGRRSGGLPDTTRPAPRALSDSSRERRDRRGWWRARSPPELRRGRPGAPAPPRRRSRRTGLPMTKATLSSWRRSFSPGGSRRAPSLPASPTCSGSSRSPSLRGGGAAAAVLDYTPGLRAAGLAHPPARPVEVWINPPPTISAPFADIIGAPAVPACSRWRLRLGCRRPLRRGGPATSLMGRRAKPAKGEVGGRATARPPDAEGRRRQGPRRSALAETPGAGEGDRRDPAEAGSRADRGARAAGRRRPRFSRVISSSPTDRRSPCSMTVLARPAPTACGAEHAGIGYQDHGRADRASPRSG